MSDGAVEEVTMQSEEQAQTPATAGAILRKAREDAHVQLPTMAATLKVPEHKLEALEADNYNAFPDHVFMRALAMGMCRSLQIESEPVLALLPRTQLRSLASTGPGINEAVKERGRFKAAGTPLDSGSGVSRKVIAGVLILLAAAAAVYFVPLHQGQGSDGAAGSPTAAPAAQPETSTVVESGGAVSLGQAPASGAVNPVPDGETAVPTAPAAGAATPASTETGSAAVATPAAPAEAPAVPAATAATAPATSTPATTNPVSAGATGAPLVEFKAQGQSWIKVKDSTGKVVMEKTLSKDQSVTAEGSLPLSVTVGNAKGTQVLVRGEPLDISTTRDNVARFEVK